MKSSTSMYESSDSHFSRTTTEIQSRPNAFKELWVVMISLTNLGAKLIYAVLDKF